MITLQDLTHHATLFVHPERKDISETLWGELQNNSKAHTFFDTTVLDIDTARSIQSWANTPYSESKLGLVSFHTITVPAQNALLKIVEEPPNGVGFIFITSNKESLLPTLLSRLNEIIHVVSDYLPNDTVGVFLKTKPGERMKLKEIVDLLNKVDENERKDRESVRTFILNIATQLQGKGLPSRYTTECFKMASYAGLPSSSTKALLEYLSLLLPQLK
jgi:DNA polymerase III, delta subunit